jgi:two-component system NtrC family sensor kinase
MRRDSIDSLKNEKTVLLKEARLNYSHKEDSLKYNQNITNAQLKQKKQQSYFFIGGITALLILSIFIWLNFNNQRKSNRLLAEANGQLSEQREEITAQRDQLANTLTNLKTTQQQLIQVEKMASLGELTAGIAHEIQNPLNFVNNFSDVSVELVDEMQAELNKGDKEEAIAISEDIKQNLEKIRHHGKRADSIVKGMLEHSRTSTGQKEPADVNKLADEYLRLAYHGLRAKNKSFNAELITDFDPDLSLVNIISQDIGRVLLNLFNNAFYATQQKQKIAGEDYKPEVMISTSAENGQVIIKVKDNGIGIPDAIKDKIMQPFFTTKPTGEGTGLGLSLSYDIVTKGHGGEIEIDSKAKEFTQFTIILPVS